MKPAQSRAAGTGAAAPPVNLEPKAASNPKDDERQADLDLVRRVQNGDALAFRALFDRYNRRVFAVALGVVKNQDDALDVMQEAFIKVHKHIGSFQGTSSFYTWMYRIVMNLAIDQVRRGRKVVDFDERLNRDDAAGDGALLPVVTGEDPSEDLTRQELSAKIQAALEQLPEYHRAVIMLREVEEMSYEDMSRVLNVPKGTIMSRLFHARRKMQEQLASYVGRDSERDEGPAGPGNEP
jgi:RNA polymerase sigma-70 factor, ECF subfamily